MMSADRVDTIMHLAAGHQLIPRMDKGSENTVNIFIVFSGEMLFHDRRTQRTEFEGFIIESWQLSSFLHA
jgi:hypothetical protein